ncbi:hypothetical protein AA309_03690 [Microvirga vignae]|uniref:Uncharacterized protein n=2 Tax=Microvirga vignae TaxID=1225564 RepID=A0A0H1RH18_9HYPH|nr:hypothetical protein AA309_03690 [Microvirga vignae]
MSAAALNVLPMSAESGTVQALERVLTTADVARGPLPDFLSVVTRIVHVLMAELADHERGLNSCVLV